jgi:hypothetical protein
VFDCGAPSVFYAGVVVKKKWLPEKETPMNKIESGDTVERNPSTRNQGLVRLGDNAPAFRAGDKVVRDPRTQNQDTVRLGDNAPAFRAGDKVVRDPRTQSEGTVRLGDNAPAFRAPR